MIDGLTAARVELPGDLRGRRDPFAPLHENPLAAMQRDPNRPGRGALAVTRRTLSRTKPDILGEGDARGMPSPVPRHRAQS